MKKRFNFDTHFERLKKAPDEQTRLVIEQEWTVFKATLSEKEVMLFKEDFDNYLGRKIEIYNRELKQAKEMLGLAEIAT